MLRRGFMGVLGVMIAGLFGKRNDMPEPVGPPPRGETIYRRIYRYSASREAWSEIRWEEMRPGDRVLAVSHGNGKLEFMAWEVESEPFTTPQLDTNGKPLGVVRTGATFDLLPMVWGTDRYPDMSLSRPDVPPLDAEAAREPYTIDGQLRRVLHADRVKPLTPSAGQPCPYEEVAG